MAINETSSAYDRVPAQMDSTNNLTIRASKLGACRQELWFHIQGEPITNPPDNDTLLMFDMGKVLEPVVLRAMENEDWEIFPDNHIEPRLMVYDVHSRLQITGHVDALGIIPYSKKVAVIEIKTRSSGEFKRWQDLGAEISHPATVLQLAAYTYAYFNEWVDGVLAKLDIGNRKWDYEVIPGNRLKRLLAQEVNRLEDIIYSYDNMPNNGPGRDYGKNSWECKNCLFLTRCWGQTEETEETEEPDEFPFPLEMEMSDIVLACLDWIEADAQLKNFKENNSQWVAQKELAKNMLLQYLQQESISKTEIAGLKLTRFSQTTRNINRKLLNELLEPDVRKQIITEKKNERIRITQ